MRLSMIKPSVALATLATLATWHIGATQPEASTPTAKVTSSATPFRHALPSTYKSWGAEASSEDVCHLLKGAQWEDCLVGHYEAKTGYLLSEYEYKADRTKKTWTVSYSKITLPKGGERLSKQDKVDLKLPTTVYFKEYGMDNGSLILGSNGTSYQIS